MRRRLWFLTTSVVIVVAGLTTTADRPAEAAFPGVNGKIAFGRDLPENLEIFAMDPDGNGQTNLTNDVGADYFPAGSPDGRSIAFTRCPRPPTPATAKSSS